MTFLNPITWGLAAISVPILIHLLNKQRYQTIDWAAQEFLKRALRKHQRKVKLQEWLLLLLRCLAIMAIVGMLLRPVANISIGETSRYRVAVIDVSASMHAEKGGRSALNNAEEALRRLIELSSDEDILEIFIVHDNVEQFSEAMPVVNRKVLLQRVDNLDVKAGSSRGCRFDDIAKKLEPHLATGDKANKEVFFFSDFQSTGLDDKTFPVGDLKEKGNVRWYFHDCGLKERENWSIIDLKLDSPNIVKNQTANVAVKVASHASVSQRVRVTLHEGDLLVGEKHATVNAGETVDLPFQVTFKEEGSRKLKAEMFLEDDCLSLDNVRQVGVNVTEAIPVVMIDGDPAGANFWRDETYMLYALLDAAEKFKIQVFKKGVDDIDAVDLSSTELLVMANMPVPNSEKLLGKITNFVNAGGSLIVTGGPNMEGTLPEAFLNLLPCTFEKKVLNPDGGCKMSLPKQVHPEMEQLNKYNHFNLSRIYKMHEVKAREGARELLRAADRFPLLLAHTVGKGKVAFWASSLDRDWCDLDLQNDYFGVFGMLAEKMIAKNAVVSVAPGKPFSLNYSTFLIGDSATLVGLDVFGNDSESSIVPEEDKENSSNKSVIKVKASHINNAGIYELSGRSGNLLTVIGVNVESKESDLNPLKDEQLETKENEEHVSLSRSLDEFNSNLGDDMMGKEIWKTLLIMAMVFLGLEGFLAWMWGNPK